jgi:nucleoside-diphosphate-sugar epimerase
MTPSLLVTGATGFIGSHLRAMLAQRDISATYAVRRPTEAIPRTITVGEVDGKTNWSLALQGVETVIHLAARAHVLNEDHPQPIEEYRRVNTRGTARLAEAMITHGCRRLVFVSSIGVNGDSTPIDEPFTEQSPPAPQQPYARAKWEAEQHLHTLHDQLEVVTVRPPLVYGPNAPGNFARLIRWVQKGLPLPLGAVHNRRSFIAVQNLCDFLIHCAQQPAAARETFLISDDETVSTTELLRRVGRSLGQPVRLLPVPPSLLRLGLSAVGRGEMARKLLGSLVVDSSKARSTLGWQPPLTLDEALATL